ncbi:PIR protein [Plasmodium yoelii]|uniref:PIR protein n=3 Tax=Plasmodium yoelii TaxID=5861 RepID=A0AAE9WMA9_PLAYO|nr:PIR protein [Plasmodium yoelii]WBY55160.1 PIR protein [Plasmodium yoelii yoelii]VTZ72779.1 PIR protein [Plasmodium yoelii]|eukprot:XP_022811018.2 PIR protein [Plasmodium yoelii]
MSSHVCDALKYADQILPDDFDFEKDHKPSNKYDYYCRINMETMKGKCLTVGQVVNIVTIILLDNLFVLNKNIESENKNNEYITYVMLWLSNKMKLIKKGRYGSVADFYVTFIQNSKKYILYHDKIDKNRKMMYLNIDRMRRLYGLLIKLCDAITKHKKDPSNCSNFSDFVNDWIKQYIDLIFKKQRVFEDEHYCDVLVTLKNAYEKFKKDNDTKNSFPEIIEIEGIKTCKQLGKEATTSSKVLSVLVQDAPNGKKDLEKGKDTSKHIDFKKIFELYSLFFSKMFTNIGNSLYENVFPTLEDFYGKLKNFAGNTINHVNKELKKAIETYAPNNCISEEKDQGSNPPSSQESLSEKGDSDQKGCEASQISLTRPVMKPETPISDVERNGTTGIGDNPFNVYKNMGISILIILIPIALAIMYKYLPFGWRKKSKKKKKMKKAINMFDTNETTEEVINPTDRKKQMKITINLSSQNKQDKKLTNSSTPKKQDKQFINSSTPKKQDKQFINSNDRKKKVEIIINSSKKKQTKDFINSTYWGKYPLLNIYKLMKADPVPFIILFLLFIFYLYKRKGDSLE